MATEEEDIIHAIQNNYQYDGLFPADWCDYLIKDSDLFNDIDDKTKVELIIYLIKHPKFRQLITNALNGYL
jgi:hypothetical protein